MKLRAFKTGLNEILPFRALHLQETNFQVRYNACHERGWTDSWLITLDDKAIGYGSVKGVEIADRDAVFEFYIAPSFRKYTRPAFSELLAESAVIFIECQSNDLMLSSMLYEFAENINSDVVLFEDHSATSLTIPGAIFRRGKDDDFIFEHTENQKEIMSSKLMERSLQPADLCCTIINHSLTCIWKLMRHSEEKVLAAFCYRK